MCSLKDLSGLEKNFDSITFLDAFFLILRYEQV